MTPANLPDVGERLRDLIVYLERGNALQAEPILADIINRLKQMLLSSADPASFSIQRAQQTMFAIDETRLVLSQGDFRAAAMAARDAAREWRQRPPSDAKGE